MIPQAIIRRTDHALAATWAGAAGSAAAGAAADAVRSSGVVGGVRILEYGRLRVLSRNPVRPNDGRAGRPHTSDIGTGFARPERPIHESRIDSRADNRGLFARTCVLAV